MNACVTICAVENLHPCHHSSPKRFPSQQIKEDAVQAVARLQRPLRNHAHLLPDSSLKSVSTPCDHKSARPNNIMQPVYQK